MMVRQLEERLRQEVARAVGAVQVPPRMAGCLVENERHLLHHRRLRRRRRWVLTGGMTVVLTVSVAVVLATSLLFSPQARQKTVELKVASYSLRLSDHYKLISASSCEPYVVLGLPSRSAPHPVPGNTYEPQAAAAARASGGCIIMVLGPRYTPTASRPDPEAIARPLVSVTVGPYNGLVGLAKPVPGLVERELYVEIPVSGGQVRDLAVGASGLSQPALLSIVANGLSVTSPPTTVDTLPVTTTARPSGA